MAKELNKDYSIFFMLLRSGLWEREIEDLSSFPLSRACWENIFGWSKLQTVTGIIYEGINHLPDNLLPPEDLLLRWVVEVDSIERKNLLMNQVIVELYNLFERKGIKPILLKGQGVATFYTKPLLRESGDVDLYFSSPQEYMKAECLIEDFGIALRKNPDQSHTYDWKGVVVQHHSTLLDVSNPFAEKLVHDFVRQVGYVQQTLSWDNYHFDIKMPSPCLNVLLLNLHILKHALGWGIGLRQLCDLACVTDAYGENVNFPHLDEIYKRLGVSKWCDLLYSFLNINLGKEGRQHSRISPKDLEDVIWRGGNFGQSLASRSCLSDAVWKRKIKTLFAFSRRFAFACKYAPKEAGWLYVKTLIGQFR